MQTTHIEVRYPDCDRIGIVYHLPHIYGKIRNAAE